MSVPPAALSGTADLPKPRVALSSSAPSGVKHNLLQEQLKSAATGGANAPRFAATSLQAKAVEQAVFKKEHWLHHLKSELTDLERKLRHPLPGHGHESHPGLRSSARPPPSGSQSLPSSPPTAREAAPSRASEGRQLESQSGRPPESRGSGRESGRDRGSSRERGLPASMTVSTLYRQMDNLWQVLAGDGASMSSLKGHNVSDWFRMLEGKASEIRRELQSTSEVANSAEEAVAAMKLQLQSRDFTLDDVNQQVVDLQVTVNMQQRSIEDLEEKLSATEKDNAELLDNQEEASKRNDQLFIELHEQREKMEQEAKRHQEEQLDAGQIIHE
ncbi:hypothetical protein CYMTET_33136, partial [Cymbomonas tetramitiformis]